MGSDLTAICVYWEGNFRSREYTLAWVEKMRGMVKRELPQANFACLTNVEGIEGGIPLKNNWPGWWSKVELFRPDLPIEGRIVYFDLDTLLLPEVKEIAHYSEKLAFMPPSYTLMGERPLGGRGIVDHCNSSVITFEKGTGTEIYTEFSDLAMKVYRGDQDWIGSIMPDLNTMPHTWFRKLKHCPLGPPEGVKVILCMPWKNNVAAKRYGWVKELWG